MRRCPLEARTYEKATVTVYNVTYMLFFIAFEYEDEDGDRITVRTDEEMSIMISHYQGRGPLRKQFVTVYNI